MAVNLPCRPLSFAVVIVIAFLMDFVVFRGTHTDGDAEASATAGDAETCWLEFKALGGSEFASNGACVDADAVRSAAARILVPLERVVQHPYFRFVRVNLEKDCPFWAVSLLCTSEAAPCSVWSCDRDDDVPALLQCEVDMCSLTLNDAVCFSAQPANLQAGGFFLRSADPLALYVDLQKNVEANTGYVGHPARMIWEAIYNENCVFELHSRECSQELVFFRLISGLHASISTHLSVKYTLLDAAADSSSVHGRYRPNCSEFQRRVGQHPRRLRNMHFLFRFLLQAVARAVESIDVAHGDMDSGIAADDTALHVAFGELKHGLATDGFGMTTNAFDSEQFRRYVTENDIATQVRQVVLNITSLMNCLECEKCRLWGKVQTTGLAAALELNLARAAAEKKKATPVMKISRPDLVALVNALRQVAEAHALLDVCCG